MAQENMEMIISALVTLSLVAVMDREATGNSPIEKGTVRFDPVGSEASIPARYRLEPHTFSFELLKKKDLPASGVEIYHLRFPSPVTSDCPENNTVFAEYYRPKGPGPFPGVVVLDITGGNQE